MFRDSMKCQIEVQPVAKFSAINLSCVTESYRDATSHQWMEEISMHKNVDFPSSISITNGVRLIATDTAITISSPKRRWLALPRSTPRKSRCAWRHFLVTKDWLRSENTATRWAEADRKISKYFCRKRILLPHEETCT